MSATRIAPSWEKTLLVKRPTGVDRPMTRDALGYLDHEAAGRKDMQRKVDEIRLKMEKAEKDRAKLTELLPHKADSHFKMLEKALIELSREAAKELGRVLVASALDYREQDDTCPHCGHRL